MVGYMCIGNRDWGRRISRSDRMDTGPEYIDSLAWKIPVSNQWSEVNISLFVQLW